MFQLASSPMVDRFLSNKYHGLLGPFPNGRTSWLSNGGDPNYLLTGMILQKGIFKIKKR